MSVTARGARPSTHTVCVCYSVREENDAAAFDEQSSSLIKLNNGTVLYLREVNKFLALVCILREDNFDHKGECLTLSASERLSLASIVTGVIDYNFMCFREAIQQVFELRNKSALCVEPALANGKAAPLELPLTSATLLA